MVTISVEIKIKVVTLKKGRRFNEWYLCEWEFIETSQIAQQTINISVLRAKKTGRLQMLHKRKERKIGEKSECNLNSQVSVDKVTKYIGIEDSSGQKTSNIGCWKVAIMVFVMNAKVSFILMQENT